MSDSFSAIPDSFSAGAWTRTLMVWARAKSQAVPGGDNDVTPDIEPDCGLKSYERLSTSS